MKDHYFEAMEIFGSGIVLINKSRFNVAKIFPENDNQTGVEYFLKYRGAQYVGENQALAHHKQSKN